MNFDDNEKTWIITEIEDHFQVNFSDKEFLSIETPFDCVIILNKYLAPEMSLT